MFTTLISTEPLAAHLDGSWAIIDCRYDLRDENWGSAQYRAGHIPGAVYASLSKDLSSAPTGSNGRHPVPCVEELEALCVRLPAFRNVARLYRGWVLSVAHGGGGPEEGIARMQEALAVYRAGGGGTERSEDEETAEDGEHSVTCP